MFRFSCGRNTKGIVLLALIAIFAEEVNKRVVEACPGTQKCTTIKECRRIQKESKYQMDLSTSVLYPCEEQIPGMICCAASPPPEEIEDEDPGYTITHDEIPKASETIPAALPLTLQTKSEDNCGTFVRGNTMEDASYLQFPWLALIGSDDVGSKTIQFQCGGTLINYQYVLSSASCISNMLSPHLMIRLGENDISKEEECGPKCGAVDSDVEQIIIHESYDYPFRKNDIALLRLKNPLPKDRENIRPICLPTSNIKYDTYTVAGWGINDNRNFSVTPKFGTLSLDSPTLCEADLSLALKPVGEKQLCSKKIKGSCYGDGGGPLMAYNKNGFSETAVLAGIISERVSRCNSPFSVDLFTNVAHYLDWINQNMRL